MTINGFRLAVLFSSLIAIASASFAVPTTPDPFVPTSRNAQTILGNYPLAQLVMIGTINSNNKLWAIIRAPNKQVYPVTIGSPIGNDNWHVTDVTAEQVIVQKAGNLPDFSTLWLRQIR